MNVSIVTFPETKVACLTHFGPPEREHDTVRKLIDWKIAHGFLDQARYRSYGLHYTDPRTVAPQDHRVDFCLSIEDQIMPSTAGIVEARIPCMRCALARDVGSRSNNQAARYLYEEWLPNSLEEQADFPVIFHYVNVGPNIAEREAITDVYLPIK